MNLHGPSVVSLCWVSLCSMVLCLQFSVIQEPQVGRSWVERWWENSGPPMMVGCLGASWLSPEGSESRKGGWGQGSYLYGSGVSRLVKVGGKASGE